MESVSDVLSRTVHPTKVRFRTFEPCMTEIPSLALRHASLASLNYQVSPCDMRALHHGPTKPRPATCEPCITELPSFALRHASLASLNCQASPCDMRALHH